SARGDQQLCCACPPFDQTLHAAVSTSEALPVRICTMKNSRVLHSLSCASVLLVATLLSECGGTSSASDPDTAATPLSISGTPTPAIQAKQQYVFRPAVKSPSNDSLTSIVRN